MLKNPYAPVIEPTLEDKVQHFIAHALEAAKGTARFKELSEKFETLEASLRERLRTPKVGARDSSSVWRKRTRRCRARLLHPHGRPESDRRNQ